MRPSLSIAGVFKPVLMDDSGMRCTCTAIMTMAADASIEGKQFSYYLQSAFLQIIGWHVDFECYFTSRSEEDDTQNMRGGMLAVGEELRDSSRAFRALR